MKYAFIALMLLSTQTDAAERRLSECGAFPGTPTEAAPFDLDLCALNEGDDITQLLLDIRTRWPGGFYVRAPSKSLTVISNTIKWPTSTKYYVFLEDQDPANKLLVQHAKEPSDFWTMWWFENFHTVKLGGANLSMTFKGNHPGLANCDVQKPLMLARGWVASQAEICDSNRGLVDFRVTDGTTAELADIRANFRYTQASSIQTWGNHAERDARNKIRQINVAGLHYATSGVSLIYGAINVWVDPDKTVLSDPYVRAWGWTGEVPGKTQGGLPMGCNDPAKDQVRIGSAGGYAFESLRGGFTIEYGHHTFVLRLVGKVGTSVSDPFVVKLKDWGVSGPGTGYPAGVRIKKTGEAIFFKGDPADTFESGEPVRFVKFVKLPSTYGDGSAGDRLPGCAVNNDWMDGISNIARFENNVGGRATRDYHFEFAGDWRSVAQGGRFLRGDLIRFGSADDTGPNYNHIVSVATDTFIGDTVILRDRSTLTGPGRFADVRVDDASAAVQGKDSTIRDTQIVGNVTIASDTERTTVRNVRFSGAARTIITIGARSSAIVSKLCAPPGSSISGTGSLTYNGGAKPLPFIITESIAEECVVAEKPLPPGDVTVD